MAKLVDAIEGRFGFTIALGADHYWLIEPDSAFDLSQEPAVNVGQPSDDLDSVRAIATPTPAELWHGLGTPNSTAYHRDTALLFGGTQLASSRTRVWVSFADHDRTAGTMSQRSARSQSNRRFNW